MRSQLTIICAAVALSACTTHIGDNAQTKALNQEIQAWRAEMEKPRDSRVRITGIPQAGERIELEKHEWLKSKRINYTPAKDGKPVTASALAQMLREKGINVMSSLSLDGYSYSGFGATNVDGEAALRLLFGPMGLDYQINDEGEYVAILPNQQKTFYLKFGSKTTKYKSGSMSGNVGSSSSGSSGNSTSGANSVDSSGNSKLVTGVSTGLDTGKGEVSIDSDFWKDLDAELSKMLTQCLPVASPAAISVSGSLPPMPIEMGGTGAMPAMAMQQMMQQAPQPMAAAGSKSLCQDQKIGNYSTNPSTGAVTIQAPHWIVEPIAAYLQNVKRDNAVTMLYEGMLISVSSSSDKQEGIDLQAFASFANGKYGMVVSNNALGGVTVTPGTSGTGGVAGTLPSVTTGGSTAANTFLGIQKLAGTPAQVFLAYLQANSDYSIKERPRVSVTNGVPGEFGQYDNVYYTQISQSASSGSTGSSMIGTTNQLVPFKVGSLLRIVPTYDAETGDVRSPITFTQSVQTGTYTTTQYITNANGDSTPIPSVIPLIRDSNYAGEVIMRDGEMIILGGQVSEKSDASGSGLPGYNANGNWLSGLMGQKRLKESRSTYYLALTLKINKANQR